MDELDAEKSDVKSLAAQQLALRLGDIVQVLELSCDGHWFRGVSFGAGIIIQQIKPQVGIFPVNHIHIKLSARDKDITILPTGLLSSTAPIGAVSPTSPAYSPSHSPYGLDGCSDTAIYNENQSPKRWSRIQVQDRSIDLAAPESVVASADSLVASVDKSDFEQDYPGYQPPDELWLSSSTDVLDIYSLPSIEYPCYETVAGLREPLIDEASHVLRDWYRNLKEYLLNQDYAQTLRIKKVITDTLRGRRQLLDAKPHNTSADMMAKLRADLLHRIEYGNYLQNMDQIVRDHRTGRALDEKSTSLVKLRNLHRTLEKNCKIKPEDRPQPHLSQLANISTTLLSTSSPSSSFSMMRMSPSTPQSANPVLSPLSTCSTLSSDPIVIPPVNYVYFDPRSLFSMPDDLEFRFSIYSMVDKKIMTDEYTLIVDRTTTSSSSSSSSSSSTTTSSQVEDNRLPAALFTEFSNVEIERHNFLICKVNRVGRMSEKDKESSNSSASAPRFRRPLAVGVLDLKDILAGKETQPTGGYAIRLVVPDADGDFGTLHLALITDGYYNFQSLPKNEFIHISARLYSTTADPIQLVKDIKVQNKNSQVHLIPRMGFPEPYDPKYPRSSLYVTLISSEFQKSSSKSVQVNMSILNDAGQLIGGLVLHPSSALARLSGGAVDSAQSKVFESTVYYHRSNPKWLETCRFDIPPNLMATAYLYITVRHCTSNTSDKSDKIFAFGFKKIMRNNGAIIPDGSIDIELYKYDRDYAALPVALQILETITALGESMGANAKSTNNMLIPLKDTLTISTYLCSNTHTETVSLIKLLNWKKALQSAYNDLPSVLKDVKFVGENELVRFTIPVLEALFGIMESSKNESRELTKSLFDNLVHLLNLVHQDKARRYLYFQNVFDEYLQTQFVHHRAASHIVFAIRTLIDYARANAKNVEATKQLKQTLAAFVHCIRIIFRCRALTRSAEVTASGVVDTYTEEAFHTDVLELFQSLSQLMSESGEHLSTTQQFAFKYFSLITPYLAANFDIQETLRIIVDFTDALKSRKGAIVLQKLAFTLSLIRGPLFRDPICRQHLTPPIVRWLKDHIGWWEPSAGGQAIRTQIYNECVDILGELLEVMQGFLFTPSTSDNPTAGSPSSNIRTPIDTMDVNSAPVELADDDSVLRLAELLPNLLEAYQDAIMESVTIPGDGPSYNQSQISSMFVSTMGGAQSGYGMSIATPPPPIPSLAHSPLEVSNASGISAFSGQHNATNLNLSMSMSSSPPPQNNTTLPFSQSTQQSQQTPQSKIVGTNSDTAKIASTFVTMFHLTSENKIAQYFVNVHREKGLEKSTRFLKQIFSTMFSILNGEAFPETWVNLNLVAHKIVFKVLKSVALLMHHEFVPPAVAVFDQELWGSYFTTVMALLNSSHLQVDFYTSQKWRTAKVLREDLLTECGQLLKAMWAAIGRLSTGQAVLEYQLRMIPVLIGPVIELTMSPHCHLMRSAVYLLYSMVKREYAFCKVIKRLESFCIDHIDALVLTHNRGSHGYRRKFAYNMCKLQVTRKADVQLRVLCKDFLFNVDRFLVLLLSLRSLPPGEEYEDERWAGILKLARFMKTIGRRDIYLKYVHQLAGKQLKSNNYVEAGWTLKLHADILTWSDNTLDAMPELGFDASQKEWERKEELLQQILIYFDEGKAWESAIGVCKELVVMYDSVAYNYEKQAENLQKMSALYLAILKQERYYSPFFRVGYYGKGFPASLRNKQFIYRGVEWEKIASFCERIQSKHSDSTLLKSNVAPKDDVLHSDGRYLQITAVTAEADTSQPILQKHDNIVIPDSIRTYYECNNVNVFSNSRPFRKGAKTANEFESMWLEKTTYITEDIFPYLLRRSEVIESQITEISPVENAVQAMWSKNRELINLEKKYEKLNDSSKTTPVNCNPLTMSINGAVDAPVNGGVPMYKSAFIRSDFVERNPDKGIWVRRLEDAIDEQVVILDRCLIIHNQLVPAVMRALHDNIVASFKKNFKEEIERLGINVQYDPPIPSIIAGVASRLRPMTSSPSFTNMASMIRNTRDDVLPAYTFKTIRNSALRPKANSNSGEEQTGGTAETWRKMSVLTRSTVRSPDKKSGGGGQ